MDKFFDFTGIYIDSYLPKNKLVQCYDYSLNPSELDGEKITILCYNLNLNGSFINYGGDVTIFCKNIICNGTCTIDVSGKNSEFVATKEPTPSGGESRNGINADNKDSKGESFELKLNGANGGIISVYAENVIGSLALKSNGGNGANGEKGGDALPGKPGAQGANDDIRIADYGTYSLNIIAEAKQRAKGGEGGPPTIGGDGAAGGNGGKAGTIYINVRNQNDFLNQNLFLIGGKGGNGGIGGNGNSGGIGGSGGIITVWFDDSKDDNQYGLVGLDRTNEKGENGKDGKIGTNQIDAQPKIQQDNLHFCYALTPNYFRSLLLKAEDYYLNSNIKDCLEIFNWLLVVEEALKSNDHSSIAKPSNYYDFFSVADFEPFFTKAKIYCNQISLGSDFFGNSTNYTTLLDESFVNKSILNNIKFISDYETLLDLILTDDNSIIASISSKNQIKDLMLKNISLLREDNQKLSIVINSLNIEIINRMTESDSIRKRVEEKKAAFEQAVNAATNGCSLSETLTTISKIVAIGVAISSGIGAIGGAAAVASGTIDLVSDFKTKFNKVNPGFDSDKWKAMFEEGANKDPSKNTSIVNKVEIVKKNANDFGKDVQAIGEAYDNLKEKNSSLITIPTTNLSDSSNKQKFMDEMKSFISDYEEAKVYQDEVLFYFDFCDVTNQKRLQFTNHVLTIVQNTNDIMIYENDIYNINSNLLNLIDNKLSSTAKTVIIDTYLRMRKFFVKLIYLHRKAIDFLELKNNSFQADFYNGRIAALGSEYQKNEEDLVDFLNRTTKPSIQTNLDNPIEISETSHPISFKALKESKFSKNKPISFYFNISPNTYGLDHVREIKIISVRVYFEGVETKSNSISFDLKHCGNSTFITKENNLVSFNHQPVIKPLIYSLTNEDKDKNKYTDVFGKTKGQYQSVNLKDDYYVGISPFANWGLFISENSINQELNLTQLKNLKIIFEYECKSENH